MFPLSEKPALVLFDCDGVLVDSEPISNPIFTKMLQQAGVHISLTGMQARYVGMAMPDIRRAVEGEFGVVLDDGWHDRYRQACDEAFEKYLKPIRGSRVAVEAVAQAGINYCVASSGPPKKMAVTLGITELMPLFEDRLFSGWDVPQSKPDPAIFLMAAEKFEVAPANCVVIEDSVVGVTAGIAAGMKVLGYAPGGGGEKLAALGAHVFTHMEDVPLLLGLS